MWRGWCTPACKAAFDAVGVLTVDWMGGTRSASARKTGSSELSSTQAKRLWWVVALSYVHQAGATAATASSRTSLVIAGFRNQALIAPANP